MAEIIPFPVRHVQESSLLAEQYLEDPTPATVRDFEELVFGVMYRTDPPEGSFLARRLLEAAPALRLEFAKSLFELETHANERLAPEMMHPLYGRPRDTIFATADTTQISVFGCGGYRRLRINDTTGAAPIITLVYKENTEGNSLLARYHDNRAVFEADDTTEVLSEGQEVDVRRLQRIVDITRQLVQKVCAEPIKGIEESLTPPF